MILSMKIRDISWTQDSNSFEVKKLVYSSTSQEKNCQNKKFNIHMINQKEMSKSFCLSYSQAREWVFIPCKLPARNIRNFELHAGNKMLKEGEDYFLDRRGAVAGLKGKKPFEVTARFNFIPERYDSIFLDEISGELKYIQGEERDIDAEEFIPELPEKSFRIFNLLITEEEICVYPVYQKHNSVAKGNIDNTVKKLNKGGRFRLCGYGDSITAIQSRTPDYKANGKFRDRFDTYFMRYPEDIIYKMQLYDLNDGEGKIHCKCSYNWFLKDFLEKKYGVKVDYLNFGIGGTQSSSGLSFDRVKEVVRAEVDLTVLAFGMNELGDSDTGKNISGIIKALKNSGSDVIIMGVPQINGNRKNMIDNWEKTNAILEETARKNNCLFVDTRRVCLGISPMHISSANLFNHPGPGELAIYGQALCDTFIRNQGGN